MNDKGGNGSTRFHPPPGRDWPKLAWTQNKQLQASAINGELSARSQAPASTIELERTSAFTKALEADVASNCTSARFSRIEADFR